MCCSKCSKMIGALFALVGVGFLLADLGVWRFWGLQWYTPVFLLGGLCVMCTGCCPDCKACCTLPEKGDMKKKK